jgi:hypothetical protein
MTNSRETFDQFELVRDLSALIDDLLLRPKALVSRHLANVGEDKIYFSNASGLAPSFNET